MIRKDIRELVEEWIKEAKKVGYSEKTIQEFSVPSSVCLFGDLQKYLDMIPEGAIEHAIEEEMAAAADEARDDDRCMGHHI